MQTLSRPARRLLAVLFAAGVVIVLDQSADLIATLLAQRIDTAAASWRFGLFGMVTSRASVLLVGDVMLLASTTALGMRQLLRVLAVLHLVVAAAGLAGLVVFLLDSIQLRGTVQAQSAKVFSGAVFRAGVIAVAAVITLGWAGVAAWRGSAKEARGGRAESLLVASPSDRREAR